MKNTDLSFIPQSSAQRALLAAFLTESLGKDFAEHGFISGDTGLEHSPVAKVEHTAGAYFLVTLANGNTIRRGVAIDEGGGVFITG